MQRNQKEIVNAAAEKKAPIRWDLDALKKTRADNGWIEDLFDDLFDAPKGGGYFIAKFA